MSMVQTKYSIGDQVVDKSIYTDPEGKAKLTLTKTGVISCIEITPNGIYYVVEGTRGKWKVHETKVGVPKYTTTRNITSRTS